MKRWVFAFSIVAVLAWLTLSCVLAVPWVRDVSVSLPWSYTVFIVMGIALLPGYLMGAMFLSNLLHARPARLASARPVPVSVLICARNEESSIYRAIRSVVAQRYDGPITILCVDNGSTDRTRAQIERAASELGRPDRTIRLLACPRPGKAHALNEALAHVKTEHFLTVDADTELEAHALATILARIQTDGAACVAGNLLAAESKTWVGKMQIYDYLLSIAAVKRYQGSYGATLVAQGAFSAYETSAVRRVGGWTPGVGEDIVLTYRLLALGRASLYEPRAVGHTAVPERLTALGRQRARWARGMFEGLHAVRPWRQPSLYAGYFEALNTSIVYLDLTYVFGFLGGALLALTGATWFVGWMTLLTLPGLIAGSASVYAFQRGIRAVRVQHSALGLLCFLALFQPIQSLCSLAGYAQALTRRRTAWKASS